jgi:hypothetical protein
LLSKLRIPNVHQADPPMFVMAGRRGAEKTLRRSLCA